MDALSRDQQDLRERVACIEVWLEVFLGGYRRRERFDNGQNRTPIAENTAIDGQRSQRIMTR